MAARPELGREGPRAWAFQHLLQKKVMRNTASQTSQVSNQGLLSASPSPPDSALGCRVQQGMA